MPYMESTPRYQTGENFADMKGLPPAALKVYSLLVESRTETFRGSFTIHPTSTNQMLSGAASSMARTFLS